MKKVFFLAVLVILVSLFSFSFVSATLSVTLLEYSPTPVQPGQVMDVYIQVDDQGDTQDGLTAASLLVLSEYPFTVEDTEDVRIAKELGEIKYAQQLHFRIRIAEDATDGLTPLKLRYTSDGISFVEKIIDININTFDARLDLTTVEQSPSQFIPGEEGELILTLHNADDTLLSNIDIIIDFTESYNVNMNMENSIAVQAMLNSRLEEVNRRVASGLSPLRGLTPMTSGMDEGVQQKLSFSSLAPLGTSNQKRIPALRTGEMIEVKFDVRALPDILPGMYALPVYINYNDEDNNPYHVRVDIPVTINMEPKLYVELSSTSLRTTDFAGVLSYTVANRGLSDILYLTLELENDPSIELLTAPRSIYLGQLGPGESKMGNFSIIAHDKNITTPLKITYRDSFNEEHIETAEIRHFIINKNYYRDMPFEMSFAWIILGLVIFALTAFFMFYLKKRD